MNVADYQNALLAELAAVDEQIDAHRAALQVLEHERPRLEYKLRNCGYRSPAAKARE